MDDGQREIEFKYAWEWFSYHARQRLTAFNFFLILMSAVVVGYTQAVNNDLPSLGAVLGALGTFVALAFWAMDVRNEELVCCGRAALDQLEDELRVSIRQQDNERAHLKDAMLGPIAAKIYPRVGAETFTHRVWLRQVIGLMGLLSLAAAVWAFLDFPGSGKEPEQTVVCQGSKTSPCWILRSSSHGTTTRR